MNIKFSKTPSKSNTDIADINELLVGYFINGGKWFGSDAKSQHDSKAKKLTEFQYVDQKEKSIVMAKDFISWAKKNKYSGTVKNVFWTARPNSMSKAVGYDVDQRKNPTDILVQFTRGPAKGFLGLSAKSTKGKTDIGFKNPGMGTIEKSLKINLAQIPKKHVEDAIKKWDLPTSAGARKKEIRANPKIQVKTQEAGSLALAQLRDAMFKKLKTMNQTDLYQYVVDDWMDASESMPPYIKVTGLGNKPPYKSKVEDPLKNDKLAALNKGNIKLEKVGNESIGVSAGGKRIMKMRFKWESEKLASSVKASGDPWA